MQTAVVADTSGHHSSDRGGFSQATVRTFRVFTDQHEREWGADCEKETNHPCAPLSPNFSAPLYPPSKYIVITDTVRARIIIDYARWMDDLREAHHDYQLECYHVASGFYAEKAAEAVQKMPPALRMAVGAPPQPVEPVQACAANNPWMLGVPGAEKPAAAKRFFPDPVIPQYREQAGMTVVVVDDPFADDAPDVDPGREYPHNYAPGRWYVSRQHENQVTADLAKGFRGTKEEAIAEAARLESAHDPLQE